MNPKLGGFGRCDLFFDTSCGIDWLYRSNRGKWEYCFTGVRLAA